jgi:hypothetical protein
MLIWLTMVTGFRRGELRDPLAPSRSGGRCADAGAEHRPAQRADMEKDTKTHQVSKVQATCSGLFFEVSSQYNQPSKGVYDSGWELAGLYQGDGVGTEVDADSVGLFAAAV